MSALRISQGRCRILHKLLTWTILMENCLISVRRAWRAGFIAVMERRSERDNDKGTGTAMHSASLQTDGCQR